MAILSEMESVLDSIDTPFEKRRNLRLAAVLIPIFRDSLKVLFIKRTMNMAHHQGQIAFPGGRFEEIDEEPLITALRETEEEVGISRKEIKVIGRLNPSVTVSKHHVYPYVGIIENTVDIRINPSEVAEYFLTDLSELMDPANFKKGFFRGGGIRSYYKIGKYRIWGITAGIISDLLNRMKNN